MSGGLFYPVQQEFYALGSSAAAVTLTTSYAGNTSEPFPLQHFSQLTVFVDYTPGAGGGGNSIQIQIEGSPMLLDNYGTAPLNTIITPIYFKETASNTSTGTITHTICEHTTTGAVAATSYKFFFYVPPAFKTLRVLAKETVVGGSAGTAKVMLLTSGGQ